MSEPVSQIGRKILYNPILIEPFIVFIGAIIQEDVGYTEKFIFDPNRNKRDGGRLKFPSRLRSSSKENSLQYWFSDVEKQPKIMARTWLFEIKENPYPYYDFEEIPASNLFFHRYKKRNEFHGFLKFVKDNTMIIELKKEIEFLEVYLDQVEKFEFE